MNARHLLQIVAIVTTATLSFPQHGAPSGGGSSGSGTGNSVKVCNCGLEDVTGATISHASEVNVIVNTTGGAESGGSQETGQSGSAYTNQTIPPGQCKWVRYVFECEKIGGFWVCELVSSNLESGPAGSVECPP